MNESPSPHRKEGGFYSEFGEDRWIAEHLALPAQGVYVDVGAGHPHYASNTAFLRERGWRGLAIDANPRWFNFWETTFFRGLIASQPTARFYENGLCSRIDEQGEIEETVRLGAVLKGFGIEKIDFMSIDLEGAEFDAFQTFDLVRHAPAIVVAEYSTKNETDTEARCDFRLRDHLLARDYRLMHTTEANFIFQRT